MKIIDKMTAQQSTELNQLLYGIDQSLFGTFWLLLFGACMVFTVTAYALYPLTQRQSGTLRVQVLWIKTSITLLATLSVLLVIAYGFYSVQRRVELQAEAVISAISIESQKLVREHLEHEVKHVAEQAAEELDIYMELNPDLGPALSLVDDVTFRAIASEPVGRTGYLAIETSDEVVFIMHPNPAFVGLKFFENETLKHPAFDEVKALARQAKTGPAAGYYDWLEKDGHITEKYLASALTKHSPQGGVPFISFATAYLSDFSFSESELQNRLSQGLTVLHTQTARQFKVLLLYVAGIFVGMLLPYIWWQRRIINKNKKHEK